MKKMRVFWVFSFIFLYGSYLWDDYKEPSDSGKVTWFTHAMLKYNANQGDGKAISKLIYGYEMDDPRQYAQEISQLLMSGVLAGYGGIKQGGEGITLSFVENCANIGAKGPERTAALFAAVRERGGGLTEYGKNIERRWLNGDFQGCPPFVKNPNEAKP